MLSPNPTNIGMYMSNYISARSIEPEELNRVHLIIAVSAIITFVVIGGILMSYDLFVAGAVMLGLAITILIGGVVFNESKSITWVVVSSSLMALAIAAVVMGTPYAFQFMLALAVAIGIALWVVRLATRRQPAYDAYRDR